MYRTQHNDGREGEVGRRGGREGVRRGRSEKKERRREGEN